MPGQLCNLWSKFAFLTPVFWLIFGEFKNQFFAYSINLDLNFHIKSILLVKMHPMCLKSTPNTPHFDLFFRFFNAVFGDPDLCYAGPYVPRLGIPSLESKYSKS